MNPSHPTDRTRVRPAARARYDRDTIHSILDEALLCHVGFVDDGQPFVLPTIHWRQEDHLYLHGSVASRSLRTAAAGEPICVTVTLLDGLVLARSAFHHSMNYRSVVVLGVAEEVTGDDKLQALEQLVNDVIPGRSEGCRGPAPKEVEQTRVVRLPLDESSAKMRTGPPVDEEADYELEHWAGVLPLSLSVGTPEPDPRLPSEIALPSHVRDYRP